MLHLVEERKRCAKLNFRLIAQVHDSLTVLAANESLNDVARICASTEPWHPLIELPGGRLIIPTETKVGTCMATRKEWKEGVSLLQRKICAVSLKRSPRNSLRRIKMRSSGEPGGGCRK